MTKKELKLFRQKLIAKARRIRLRKLRGKRPAKKTALSINSQSAFEKLGAHSMLIKVAYHCMANARKLGVAGHLRESALYRVLGSKINIFVKRYAKGM